MSENQLNPIETSQQPQNEQKQTSINPNNFDQTQATTQGQQVAKETQIHNEQGQMNMPSNDYQRNYQPKQIYHQENNNNLEEDKKIILQNEEGQIQNSSYYQGRYNQQNSYPQSNGHQRVQGSQNQDFETNNTHMNEGINQEIQVKIFEDGYNYEPQEHYHNQSNENGQNLQFNGEQQQIIEEQMYEAMNGNGHANQQNNQNYIIQNEHNINGQNSIPHNLQHSNQQIPPQTNEQIIESQQKGYNSYVQAVLNSPMNPASQPSHEALQQIYNQLKTKFPQCMPQQIILLLYNNLIKIPREEMIEQQAQHFDQTLKYDGGKKYFQQVSSSPNKGDMFNYELRKQMVKVYVTKGYGLKVYQQHMLSINPNTQPIDKEKFKSHFVTIYKTVIKKVQEFLSFKADRQFQPITRKQFHLTLGDVINCRKHYTPQFCQVFFKLIQATFDPNFDKDYLPHQGQVIFFYRTILGKVRQQKIILAKKMHLPEQEKDTDIWTEEFQYHFIKLFIVQKNIFQAKIKLIQQYPEFDGLLTDQKLKQKIENAIRIAIRWVQIQNQNCGNPLAFTPSDIDKRFIMMAPSLEQSRIKLLKVYVKKPKDPQVLSDIVNFINKQLRNKYEQQRIPLQVFQKSTIKQIPRNEEKNHLQKIIKTQIMRNP